MTDIILPIIGQGSQPIEEDGAELDYLLMPEEMFTYRMPQLSMDLNAAELAAAKSVALTLQQQLADFPKPSPTIDLTDLNPQNRRFIDELIGEGEVAARCGDGWMIQEAVLAGVWRLQRLDQAKRLVADSLEVGIIPQSLLETAFTGAAQRIAADLSQLPDGVMNAPPLIAELNAHIAAYQPGDEPHVINLSLLPQTEQDLAFLEQSLGSGPTTILSRGYGNCRISATATHHVWWVRYFNSQDTLILNTLEVCAVPSVACASAEDIADSEQRLREILAIYL